MAMIFAVSVFAVGATPPSGGYTPGSELDPDCLPNAGDCYVSTALSLASGQIFIGNGSGIAAAVNPNGVFWKLAGNSSTTPGTDFIGTTDAQALIFKTNNSERLRITSGGNVGIGDTNPLYKLSVTGEALITNGNFLVGTTDTISQGTPAAVLSYYNAGTGLSNYFQVNATGNFAGSSNTGTGETSGFSFTPTQGEISYVPNSSATSLLNLIKTTSAGLSLKSIPDKSVPGVFTGIEITSGGVEITGDTFLTTYPNTRDDNVPVYTLAETLYNSANTGADDAVFSGTYTGTDNNQFSVTVGGGGNINWLKLGGATASGSISAGSWTVGVPIFLTDGVFLTLNSATYPDGDQWYANITTDTGNSNLLFTDADGKIQSLQKNSLLLRSIKELTSVTSFTTPIVSGINSVAIGSGSHASGVSAVAFTGGTASGMNSFAFNSGTASGSNTVAFNGGTASGDNSIAFSGSGTASGSNAFSFSGGTASGDYSVAFNGGTASGISSFTFGTGSTASGIESFAFGTGSTASGINSFAFGNNSTASGANSFAFGNENGAVASGENGVAIGDSTLSGINSISIGHSANGGVLKTGMVGLGFEAGGGSLTASNAISIGYKAGRSALSGATAGDFSNAIFLGENAGRVNQPTGISPVQGSRNSAKSIFIGKNAGYFLADDGLDTSGAATDYAILIGNNTSTGGFENSIALGGNAVNTASNELMIGSTTNPIDTLVLTGSSGNTCTLDVTVAAPSCSSDETLKTNIETLDNATLSKLINVKTVSYTWKNYPDHDRQIGFLAQDLEQYFPSVVSIAPNGFKTVSYGGMTPIIVQAIREMNLNITDIVNIETPNTWRDALLDWFKNTSNGITEFIAGTLRAKNEICIDDVCINKNQLQTLLQNNATGAVSSGMGNSSGSGIDSTDNNTGGEINSDTFDTINSDISIDDKSVNIIIVPVLDTPTIDNGSSAEISDTE